MQFIPSTWSVVGVDGDGDGKRNPQDIDDAALATAVYLCSGDEDLVAPTPASAPRSTATTTARTTSTWCCSIMQAYADGDFSSVPDQHRRRDHLHPRLRRLGPTSGHPRAPRRHQRRRRQHRRRLHHGGGGTAGTGGARHPHGSGDRHPGGSGTGGTGARTGPTPGGDPAARDHGRRRRSTAAAQAAGPSAASPSAQIPDPLGEPGRPRPRRPSQVRASPSRRPCALMPPTPWRGMRRQA